VKEGASVWFDRCHPHRVGSHESHCMNRGAKNPYLEALGRFSTVRHLDNNPRKKDNDTALALWPKC
jgi:hypothetical protein